MPLPHAPPGAAVRVQVDVEPSMQLQLTSHLQPPMLAGRLHLSQGLLLLPVIAISALRQQSTNEQQMCQSLAPLCPGLTSSLSCGRGPAVSACMHACMHARTHQLRKTSGTLEAGQDPPRQQVAMLRPPVTL